MHYKIFNFEYNFKNIELFLENAFMSAFSANIFVPIILLYLVFDFLNPILLGIWIASVSLIFLIRIFIIKKLLYLTSIRSDKTEFYLKILIGLIFIGALLTLYIMFLSIANNIPTSTIFIFAIIIITLSAGSASTLLAIFNVYLYFILFNMISFMIAILYFGGSDFLLFVFILSIFTIISLKTGYNQYLLINKISTLNETFHTIYESSSDGIILFQNNRFKDCNSAVIKMFGYDYKDEFLATHILITMPKYQEDGNLSIKKMLQIQKLVYEQGNHTFQWQHKKKDGTIFWVDCTINKIYINDEELLHATYRDITQRKELEKDKEKFQETLIKQVEIEVEENRKKDKMLMYQSRLAQMGEMISMIAHQWRQPLNAITIATGAIQLKATRDKLDMKTAIEISNNITKFALHLSSTIDDFRNFFKTNKVMKTTDYKKLIDNVLLIIESSLKNKQISVQIQIKELIELTTYENELKQVLLNLIKNAEDILIEKEISNPIIEIIIDKNKLIISDNAGGIPDNIIEKIFDPYFSTKTKKDGTGLGLYMSKIIIEKHCGGKLLVENTKKGASFSITL